MTRKYNQSKDGVLRTTVWFKARLTERDFNDLTAFAKSRNQTLVELMYVNISYAVDNIFSSDEFTDWLEKKTK